MSTFKSLFYSLLLMVVLIGCSGNDHDLIKNGEPNEQTNPEEKANETTLDYDGDGGFLWKVVNGETTVYLLGSTHLGHEDFYPLAKKIEEAFESSDVILPEINMLEVDVNEDEITELALFEDDTTLKEVLSEESYAKLSDIFEANGIDLETYNNFEPWFVESLFTDIIHGESDLAPEHGVDLYFLQRAAEDDKEIIGLETVEKQYEVLSGFSMDTQVQNLEDYIKTYEEQVNWLNELGYNWVHGNSNPNSLINHLADSLENSNEEYRQEMNDTRNINMANKLDEILQNDSGQTYFGIVGSMHVVIEPSIPRELEEKGYDVERVY